MVYKVHLAEVNLWYYGFVIARNNKCILRFLAMLRCLSSQILLKLKTIVLLLPSICYFTNGELHVSTVFCSASWLLSVIHIY